jgi:hypothetical protein
MSADNFEEDEPLIEKKVHQVRRIQFQLVGVIFCRNADAFVVDTMLMLLLVIEYQIMLRQILGLLAMQAKGYGIRTDHSFHSRW